MDTNEQANVQEELADREERIQEQIDKIGELVESETPAQTLQQEFRQAVELITKKYETLVSGLSRKKLELQKQEYEMRSQELRDEYKREVIQLAVAIDHATGHTETIEQENGGDEEQE